MLFLQWKDLQYNPHTPLKLEEEHLLLITDSPQDQSQEISKVKFLPPAQSTFKTDPFWK